MNNENSSKPFSPAAVVNVVSLAAAAIPDTPIVSIAGSTLSEITTTTTSTKTTPTPVPTSTAFTTTIEKRQQQHPTKGNDIVAPPTAAAATKPMSEGAAAAKPTGATSITTGAAVAADARSGVTNNSTNNSTTSGTVKKGAISPTTTALLSEAISALSSLAAAVTTPAAAHNDKCDEATKTTESELGDWEDGRLKRLLDEAYSYKNPRDKKNKSETFLKLLEQAEEVDKEKDDQAFLIRANTSSSRSARHHTSGSSSGSHKQGGSLQDLSFNAVGNELLLDCDYNYAVGGGRNRRNNHNSRQKKYSSVSSRQREGGSLPSNVNVTHCVGAVHLGSLEQAQLPLFMPETQRISLNNSSKPPPPRRSIDKFLCGEIVAATAPKDTKEILGGVASSVNDNSSASVGGVGGDCVIEMDEPMIDIKQQHQILQTKPVDTSPAQGVHFYDRLNNIEMHIPRASISTASDVKSNGVTTRSLHYVDEGVRFGALDRNPPKSSVSEVTATCNRSVEESCALPLSMLKVTAAIEAKYLPLDENSKACKSVMGDKAELCSKTAASAPMFSTTKSNAQRQYDENGNALSEMFNTATAAIMNASAGGVNTAAQTAAVAAAAAATAAALANPAQSQAKAKLKKKSQQERNTKTVDVESVAGYRGKDPVEELVKYIENKDDKQNSKKKERKRDKEKQHKMKKSNSLEELRSCSKIDVDDLKRTAATTESNVMMRNKGSNNTPKQSNSKNNSCSTADINRNFDSNKEISGSSNKISPAAQVTVGATRKGERRSWGTEELQYLGDSNYSYEEKEKKEREKEKKGKNQRTDKDTEKEKDIVIKEKIVTTIEKSGDRSITAECAPPTAVTMYLAVSKVENKEKLEKRSKKIDTILMLTNTTATSAPTAPAAVDAPTTLPSVNNTAPIAITSINNIVNTVDDAPVEGTPVISPETEEFHVVTKKKKPKKQRIAGEETSNSYNMAQTVTGFNRTHNFITNMQQKGAPLTLQQQQQQQQQQSRYKHYNNNNNSFNSERGSLDYFGACNHNSGYNNYNNNNSNYGNNYNSYGNNNHQYQHHQQHNSQHSATSDGSGSRTGSGDKSRRKSTSSMPPSEKSDSSDLDSVHSLPIESSAASKQRQQRHKNTNSPPRDGADNNNSPAPISYADIAAAAAATASSSGASGAAAEKWLANDVVSTAVNSNILGSEANVAATVVVAVADEAATQVNSSLGSAVISKAKSKKAAKPDFPELVATTAATLAAATATNSVAIESIAACPKGRPISYSQRLTSSAVMAVPATGSDGATVTAVASPTEDLKEQQRIESIVNTPVVLRQPQQPLQQAQAQQQAQPLQKSKSVEHETYNYNSSTMDQQYPALEKTVKRHSAINVAHTVATIGATPVTSPPAAATPSGTAFNFAAAAKQQIISSSSNEVKSHQTMAAVTQMQQQQQPLSTSNIAANALVPQCNATTAINNSNASVTFKKPKERLLPAPVGNVVSLSSASHVFLQPVAMETLPAVNNYNSAAAATKIKTKPGKQQQPLSIAHRNLPATKTAMANTVIGFPVAGNKSLQRLSIRSNSLATANVSGKCGAATQTALAAASGGNRPAVIILDDRRTHSVSNDFTFGDFNEDELKLFDEDKVAETAVDLDAAGSDSDETINNNMAAAMPNIRSLTKFSPITGQKRATSTAYFNDSGTYSLDVVSFTQQAEDMILLSAGDASSPNSSFAPSNLSSANNQSGDSGICNHNITTRGAPAKHSPPMLSMSVTKDFGGDKLNTFLHMSGTTVELLSPEDVPMPQQLETCDDIEAAILAAARAAAATQAPTAAEHSYQQQLPQPPQPQPYEANSNSFSKSSSFSSTSSVSIDAKNVTSTVPGTSPQYQHQPPQYYYHHLQQPSQPQHNSTHGPHAAVRMRRTSPKNEFVTIGEFEHSRSSSCSWHEPSPPPQQQLVAVGLQRKDVDLHYMPPSSTAFSLQQHNGIIVDFIGSAWEEVAKVAKFYDAQ